MQELVDHILYVANQNRKRITHLQLHKVTYFTFGYLIREKYNEMAESLYKNNRFEAWKYGPVIPEIYDEFKMYTSTPIIYNGKKSNRLNDVPNINEVILSLINQDVFDLVNISHRHNFWFRNKQSISNNRRPKYSYAELVKEFSIK